MYPLGFTGAEKAALAPDEPARHRLRLLTVGGIPSIYYGDEQAFRGVKEERAGGDDGVRPAFPASPADLPSDLDPPPGDPALVPAHSWLILDS